MDDDLRTIAEQLDDAYGLADERERLRPSLVTALAPRQPQLHAEDYSAISSITLDRGIEHYTSRAVHRAAGRDVVVATGPAVPEYDAYLRDRLGIEPPRYVQLDPAGGAGRHAVFRALLAAPDRLARLARDWAPGEAVVIHPFQSTADAWRAAAALAERRGTPVAVLGPTPRLSEVLNDKNAFLGLARQLLGEDATVPFTVARTAAAAAAAAQAYARGSARVVVKLSRGSAGTGARHLDRAALGRPPRELERTIEAWRAAFPHPAADGETYQVSPWFEDVLAVPGIEVWIPPAGDGSPVVDAVVAQTFSERLPGVFSGYRTVAFPARLRRRLERTGQRLGQLLQALGYVGRCSFDALVRGVALDRAAVQLIECNARWGGVSTPLAFLGRVFDDLGARPYVVRIINDHERLEGVRFARLAEELDDLLYDRATDRGWFLPLNVGTLKPFGRFTAVTFGGSAGEALERQDELDRRIAARF